MCQTCQLFIATLVMWLLATQPVVAQQIVKPAQPLSGESPSAGTLLPYSAVADPDDATTLEINPAGLALLNSWRVSFQHAQMRRDGRVGGSGTGFWASTRVPLLSALSIGVGAQWLRPSTVTTYGSSAKLSLGFGLRLSNAVAIGIGLHTFLSRDDASLDALNSLDLGLVLRPLQFLALGLSIHDVTGPLYGALPLQRRYEVEAAIRPLRDRRLQLDLGVQIGERRREVDPYWRIQFQPLTGLILWSHMQLLQRDFDRDQNDDIDFRATVGMGIEFEQTGLQVSTTWGKAFYAPNGAPSTHPWANAAAASAYQGMSVGMHLRGERRAPIVEFKKKLLLLTLKGELTQREWITFVAEHQQLASRADVAGVALHIDGLQAGWAQIQELRTWLIQLRRAGKQTIAYVNSPSFREYYLATATDQIWLDASGAVDIRGLMMQSLHFKGLLDKVGVSAQMVRIAEYKSAPEMFTHPAASAEAQAVRSRIADSMFSQIQNDVVAQRKLSAEKWRELIDIGLHSPEQAVSRRLVDRVIDDPQDLLDALSDVTSARVVDADTLHRSSTRWPMGPHIAVVMLEGDIVRGKNVDVPLLGRQLLGDETIAATLKSIGDNRQIKAVVLRIDSPGGSAIASERMWTAVKRLQQRKPVVVSIGDMAASGGYFAACSAKHIYAMPASLVGSIGVFAGKADFSGLMQKLGVATSTTQRGKFAALYAWDRPFSDAEHTLMMGAIQHLYGRFTNAVKKGRNYTAQQIDQVAKGRIFIGIDAKQSRLVDTLGGFTDALNAAKKMGGIAADDEVAIAILPKQSPGLLTRVIDALTFEPKPASILLPPALAQLLSQVPAILLATQPGEVLARLPYNFSY